ncbi:zf-CCHC domain-containing protein [Tanacetum coccineum]|uniref:Zf-CCHC domain-containing protein n=1 Tax=Tanacetum coccineum TaxID=301880 RepID=A0ABQ5JDI7_9ASTR
MPILHSFEENKLEYEDEDAVEIKMMGTRMDKELLENNICVKNVVRLLRLLKEIGDFNTIIASLKALDESFSSRNHVRKFLRALPTKWRPKVTAIEESKDLSTLPLDELILLSKEEATSSDSNDEEYVMAIRDFKKFFDRRGKFVRQPHDDKRNFWKAKEDKKEKDDRRCFNEDDSNKEEMCLMALDDNEVRLKVKLEPDKWIKDSGCSRHITGNKDLFSSYKTIDGDYLTKFDPKSTKGIFLGYSPNSKAYVVLNRETMRVEESLNVKFDESLPPKTPPSEDDDVLENENIERQEKDLEIKENEPLNKEIPKRGFRRSHLRSSST